MKQAGTIGVWKGVQSAGTQNQAHCMVCEQQWLHHSHQTCNPALGKEVARERGATLTTNSGKW
jgi:hypothetical protein